MKTIVMTICLLAMAAAGWSEEVIWSSFYEASVSLEEAKAVPLTSTDAQALKKAGVYYFSLVNGSNGMAIDKKNREENAKQAMDYLSAASELDKGNPIMATWKATATLSYAGASKKLANKIKYSNLGISYFNQAARSQSNMDYLFMRIVSYSQIPKSFKDMTSIIKSDAARYMKLYDSLDIDPGLHELLKETVKTMEAYAFYQTRDKDKAKEIWHTVDEKMLLEGQGEDTNTAEVYFMLKKKLRIK
ncbi:MAG: hypothetical protein B0D92_04085 [Spirochaeta sp. LUC14_002_19_P3]|nr:MAG: hypothetical protein B0D92_04085 [Spirochaeta sp. LUC14_002_19_P3]